MHSILKIALAVFFVAVARVCPAAEIDNRELHLQVAGDTDWQFRQLVNDYLRAWSPGCRKFDMALATQFYETTDRFSGFHFLAPIEGPVGWGRYGSEMAKVMSDFDQYTILPNEDDFRLTREGTHVSTATSYRVVGRNRDRKSLDTRARVLLVWERVNDRWLICREEVTSLLSRSTAAR